VRDLFVGRSKQLRAPIRAALAMLT
jgi:hypothetical protein